MSADLNTMANPVAVPGKATQGKDEIGPGALIWAKLSRYPWWPALVLERSDKRIPVEERRSTLTSTPVLFFGTAEFSWIDASRNISPWEVEKLNRSTKDKSAEFKRALQEANAYATKGNLPTSFVVDAYEEQSYDDDSLTSPISKSGKRKGPWTPPRKSGGPPYPLLWGEELHFDDRDRRRLTVQRYLGLAPPWNSPAAAQPVLNPNLGALMQQPLYQQHTTLPPNYIGQMMM